MFNVLYEPWMGVVDMDGNETLVGLPHRNRCEPACKEAETSEQFCRSKAN